MNLVLEFLIRTAAVAVSVGAILAVARVRSGAVCHAAWTAVLCAMLLMPVLPHLTPAVGLPVTVPAISLDAPAVQEMALPAQVGREAAPSASAPAIEPHAAPPPPARGPAWPAVAFLVYCAGLILLLARTGVGWCAASRVARVAEPVADAAGAVRVRQSDGVATPVTVGVLKPCIVLPREWAGWPEAKLRAVLAHESAHVRRRDALVALAARLNRCLFWFHPLAWWLERKLAITAEQACDEAGVRAMGEVRAYARVLLEMAESVRRNGGRLSWQGSGMDGGALEQRIDQVLRGGLARRLSRSRKAAVFAACAAVIFGVAACRQKPASDATLAAQAEARAREDKECMDRYRASFRADREAEAAALAMTREQVAALEAEVRKNPGSYEGRKKLLLHYDAVLSPYPRIAHANSQILAAKPPSVDHAAEKAAVAAGLPHAFWMIEHHPEDPIAARWNAGIVPTIFDPQPDAANLARASKLWMEQADRDGRPASVYANAFQFLRMIDKPTAEKMLLRTQAADPTGESLNTWMKASWPARLGNFYAGVVAGNGGSGRADSTDPYRNFISRAMGPVDPGSAYAAEVRKKLEQSKDVTVLLSAATPMVSMRFPEQHSEGSDPFAFGKTLVQRALELQPQSTWAHQLLNKATDQELTARLPVAVWQGPLESRQQAIQTLLEGDRFRELAILAMAAGDDGVRADRLRHDPAGEKAAWHQAGKYASEALQIASQARSHPDYGTALFNANMAAGMSAAQAGDPKAAAMYLLKAADAPATDALKYPIVNARPWRMNWHFPTILETALLKAGQRDAVLDFLERYSRMSVPDRDRCLEDIALIRQGKLPAWAQN